MADLPRCQFAAELVVEPLTECPFGILNVLCSGAAQQQPQYAVHAAIIRRQAGADAAAAATIGAVHMLQKVSRATLCRPPSYAGTPARAPQQQAAPYAYAPTPGAPHYGSMPTPVPAATPAMFQEPDPGEQCDP